MSYSASRCSSSAWSAPSSRSASRWPNSSRPTPQKASLQGNRWNGSATSGSTCSVRPSASRPRWPSRRCSPFPSKPARSPATPSTPGASVIAVAIGVAIGVALGAFRIVTGTPLPYFIIAGYIVVIVQTFVAPRTIVPLAYDSGGVTTSTVTVPLLAALGLGLASTIPGRSPIIDGFGLIAFASLFPIMTVMAYAQLAQIRTWRRSRRREETELDEVQTHMGPGQRPRNRADGQDRPRGGRHGLNRHHRALAARVSSPPRRSSGSTSSASAM